jgi:hypothetical protein
MAGPRFGLGIAFALCGRLLVGVLDVVPCQSFEEHAAVDVLALRPDPSDPALVAVPFAQPDLHVPQKQEARQTLAGLGAEGLALLRSIDTLEANAFRPRASHQDIHRVPIEDADHPTAENLLAGSWQRKQQAERNKTQRMHPPIMSDPGIDCGQGKP